MTVLKITAAVQHALTAPAAIPYASVYLASREQLVTKRSAPTTVVHTASATQTRNASAIRAGVARVVQSQFASTIVQASPMASVWTGSVNVWANTVALTAQISFAQAIAQAMVSAHPQACVIAHRDGPVMTALRRRARKIAQDTASV